MGGLEVGKWLTSSLLPRRILAIRERLIAEVVSLARYVRVYSDDSRAVLVVIVVYPYDCEIGYGWAPIIHRYDV